MSENSDSGNVPEPGAPGPAPEPGPATGAAPAADPGAGAAAGPAPGPGPAPGSGAGPAPSGHSGADEFFDRIRRTGAVRPDQHRWFAGVCAGLARRLNLDPLLVRGIFVALAVIGGFGLLLYGVAWLLMPEEDGRIHAQEAMRGHVTAGFVGAVLCILADLGRGAGPLWWQFGFLHANRFTFNVGGLITIGLVILAIWWWARQGPGSGSGGGSGGGGSGTVPPPPGGGPAASSPEGWSRTPAAGQPPAGTTWGAAGPGAPGGHHTVQDSAAPARHGWAPRPDPAAPSRTLTRITLGLALLAAGVVAAIGHAGADLPGPTWLLATTVALGVVALGVVAAGVMGRRAGGLAPIGVLLAAVVLIGALIPTPSSFTVVGSRTWRPVTAAEARDGLSAGLGGATIDLTDPGILGGASAVNPVQVDSAMGVGQLRVLPPPDQPTEIHASVGAGNITERSDADGSSQQLSSGTDLSTVVRTGPAGPPLLVVTVKVGLGTIEIVSATPVEVTR